MTPASRFNMVVGNGSGQEGPIGWIVRARPYVGELVSGDAAVIHSAGETVWVGVIDGLGHGPGASAAAVAARDALLEVCDSATTLTRVFALLHEVLRPTRGAAATIVRFDRDGVEFGGIGNVALRGLDGLTIPFAPVGGVLGGRCRPVRTSRARLEAGARLLLMSDGISRRTPIDGLVARSGEEFCDIILRDHSYVHDDATVALVEFLGTPGRANE